MIPKTLLTIFDVDIGIDREWHPYFCCDHNGYFLPFEHIIAMSWRTYKKYDWQDADVVILCYDYPRHLPLFKELREQCPCLMLHLTNDIARFELEPQKMAGIVRDIEQADAVLVENDFDYAFVLLHNPQVFKVGTFFPYQRYSHCIKEYVKPGNFTVLHSFCFEDRGYERHPILWIDVCEQLQILNMVISEERLNHKYVICKEKCDQLVWYQSVLSQASCGLAMSPRMTYGRFASECALFGIPCIGTRFDSMERFFPELIVFPHDINKVVELLYEAQAGNLNDIAKRAQQKARVYFNNGVYQEYVEAFKACGIYLNDKNLIPGHATISV